MTVKVLALIALVLTVVGLGAASHALADAVTEHRVARRVGGQARRMFAVSTLRSQVVRVSVLSSLAGVATFALVDLPNRRAVNITLLMGVIVLTAVDSVVDRFASRQIVTHLRKRYAQGEEAGGVDDELAAMWAELHPGYLLMADELRGLLEEDPAAWPRVRELSHRLAGVMPAFGQHQAHGLAVALDALASSTQPDQGQAAVLAAKLHAELELGSPRLAADEDNETGADR